MHALTYIYLVNLKVLYKMHAAFKLEKIGGNSAWETVSLLLK